MRGDHIKILITHNNVTEQEESTGNELDKELFRKLDDIDGLHDNRIDCNSLNRALWVADHRRGSQELHELRDMITDADKNSDGYLELTEFLELCQKIGQKEVESQRQRDLLEIMANAEIYRCWPLPLFTFLMVLLQVSISIYHTLHFRYHWFHRDHPIILTWDGPYLRCSKLIFNPYRRYEIWRFMTYFVVHSGYKHLLFNGLLQLLVGIPLEMTNQWWRVAIIFFSGILADSLATSTLLPSLYQAGSSGAAFALIGAHLASIILNWKENHILMRDRLRYFIKSRFKENNRYAKGGRRFRNFRAVFIFVLVIMELAFNSNREGSILAHLSGFAAGFLMGMVILENREVEGWETKVQRVCYVLMFLLFMFAVVWAILGDSIWQYEYGKKFFKNPDYGWNDGHGNGTCIYHSFMEI